MVRPNSNKIWLEKKYTKESEAENFGPEEFEIVSVYEYFSALSLNWTCYCGFPLLPHCNKYKKTAFQ